MGGLINTKNFFLLNISNINLIDFFSYAIIVLCIILFCILYWGKVSTKFNIFRKIFVGLVGCMILLYLVTFSSVVFDAEHQGKIDDDIDTFSSGKITAILNEKHNNFNSLLDNKIILVGDSRTSFIRDYGNVVIPINVNFIAKGGIGYNWFANDAISMLEKNLINRDKKNKYNVIINMGVNDINLGYDVYKSAEKYFRKYKYLVKKYKDVNFYLLSINPIDEAELQHRQYHDATNKKIENFNKEIVSLLSESKLSNLFYCNSYDEMSFEIEDGIHYTDKTNEEILKYITNECVLYQ